jgi:hypothetical protein
VLTCAPRAVCLLLRRNIIKGGFSYSGQRCTAVKVRCLPFGTQAAEPSNAVNPKNT